MLTLVKRDVSDEPRGTDGRWIGGESLSGTFYHATTQGDAIRNKWL